MNHQTKIMKKQDFTYVKLMEVFAGIAMVGYGIEAGTKIIATLVGIKNPASAHDLFKDLDINAVYLHSKISFFMSMTLLIAIPMLKSAIWWEVIVLLRKLDLQNPFARDFTTGFNKIVNLLSAIVILSVICNLWHEWLEKTLGEFSHPRLSVEEYLFMTALVFILTRIFRKGYELKQETDLTV